MHQLFCADILLCVFKNKLIKTFVDLFIRKDGHCCKQMRYLLVNGFNHSIESNFGNEMRSAILIRKRNKFCALSQILCCAKL